MTDWKALYQTVSELADKHIVTPLSSLYPILFIAQCAFVIDMYREKRHNSFFLEFLTVVGGSTLVSTIITHEVPAWLNVETYLFVFGAVYLAFVFGAGIFYRYLRPIGFHLNLLAVSHIVINNLIRVSSGNHKFKSLLMIMLVTAFLAGAAPVLLPLEFSGKPMRRLQFLQVSVTTWVTAFMYMAFTNPHLLVGPIPDEWIAKAAVYVPRLAELTALKTPIAAPLVPTALLRKSIPWMAAAMATVVGMLGGLRQEEEETEQKEPQPLHRDEDLPQEAEAAAATQAAATAAAGRAAESRSSTKKRAAH
ncbi:hypothetical protein PAPYR_4028 [Paratrimastix pyriformis]|uniref:Uncharacterized protein n=1 Tax=Paratrimastix pyriformis TaxID=342808 RepID=A0ABQ8UL78_9EUKA|nr:hypothetical protein PAPYR_4028 [Paratrimastix pyriformis]